MAEPSHDLSDALTPEGFARRVLEMRDQTEKLLAQMQAGGFPAKDVRAIERELRMLEKLITKHGLIRYAPPNV